MVLAAAVACLLSFLLCTWDLPYIPGINRASIIYSKNGRKKKSFKHKLPTGAVIMFCFKWWGEWESLPGSLPLLKTCCFNHEPLTCFPSLAKTAMEIKEEVKPGTRLNWSIENMVRNESSTSDECIQKQLLHLSLQSVVFGPGTWHLSWSPSCGVFF